jgi:hypothetical protein
VFVWLQDECRRANGELSFQADSDEGVPNACPARRTPLLGADLCGAERRCCEASEVQEEACLSEPI